MTSSLARSFFVIEFAALLGFGLSLAGCDFADDACADRRCALTKAEWERAQSLAGLGLPETDPANKYVGNQAAIVLGQKFYFDSRFSGVATQVDVLNRPSLPARAPKGQPAGISCATCHDPLRGGSDYTSAPGHVSVGAGWYDVNSQSTINSAYYALKYWNGRYDSLVWQAMAVTESPVSMGANRLRVTWHVHDLYRAEYEAVFGAEHPLPNFGRSFAEQAARLAADGQCQLVDGACPSDCRVDAGDDRCFPIWPLEGRPGDGTCNRGSAGQPFGDAFDCMAPEDRTRITRTYVNFAKAIAAYEYTLISVNSRFDRYVAAGPDSNLLSAAEKRGLKLYVGKASCIDCHSGPLLSDERFYNIGVPQTGAGVPREADCPAGAPRCDCVEGIGCAPWGFHNGLRILQAPTTLRIDREPYSDNPSDRSRAAFYDLEPSDRFKGAWRTPSLRDVSKTAPYMHNGYYATLEDVIWHYDVGGTRLGSAPEALDPRITPLDLTDPEVQDLIAFLLTLDGEPLPIEQVTAPVLP